ncbi:MAG: hypothetical protein IPN27_07370 [Cellvibrionales bacterium]|nr:hypothetical protein [Cellvibrionales bacterium]
MCGIHANAGLQKGIQIQTSSMVSMLAGGIAFDTPNENASKDIHDGSSFKLFDNEQQATVVSPSALPGVHLNLKQMMRRALALVRQCCIAV